MTDRRNPNAVSGYVNFPTDKYENSGEGGVFVRLVVEPIYHKDGKEFRRDFMLRRGFMQCCGGTQSIAFDECYIGDDLGNYDNYHFPRVDEYKSPDQYNSIPYLCAMTLGSTGWSSGYWICTYDDLTDEGKSLYDRIKTLYGDCGRLILQTWLDT